MKFQIDISVFGPESAVGNITGEMHFPFPPIIGDTVSFLFPMKEINVILPSKFNRLLKVKSRVITPGVGSENAILVFEDVSLNTRDEALVVLTFFEEGYDLFSTIY